MDLKTWLDAKNRALRTLLQGLVLDIAAAVVMVVATALPGVQWTRAWWVALGLLALKTAGTAVSSWVHRYIKAPPAP